MTADSIGGYVASASSTFDSTWPAYKAFNRIIGDEGWQAATSLYSTTGTYSGSSAVTNVNGTSYTGEWIQLRMPMKTKISKIGIAPRTGNSLRGPKNGTVLGSDDGSNWYTLVSWTGATFTDGTYTYINVNTTSYYMYYVLVAQEINTDIAAHTANIGELEYWGTEEGDESVDVIHRSVPNKPGTQQLAVYYEARDPNSYSFADSSNVYDLSGNGVTGTLTNGVGYDAVDNAFTFDGVDDYVSGTLPGTATGAWVHSVSCWFKCASTPNLNYVFSMGTTTTSKESALQLINSNTIRHVFYSNDVDYPYTLVVGEWVHVALTYDGSSSASGRKLYVNGIELTQSGTNGTIAALNLVSPASFRIGARIGGTSLNELTGSIANFRVFSKVLNADQVRELYEYDAERFGHRNNLVALHRGNLGIGTAVPAYTLDVLGNIYASGNIIMYSDARLKENIKVIENALDKVCSISGYTFNKKGETVYNTGVLAQEVLRILPEVVHGSEETNYSVAYGNMVGILIEAIKELKAKNDALQDIVHRLANM